MRTLARASAEENINFFPAFPVGDKAANWADLGDAEKKSCLEQQIALAVEAVDRSAKGASQWQLAWIRAAIHSTRLGLYDAAVKELSDAFAEDAMPDYLMSAWLAAANCECAGVGELRDLLLWLKRQPAPAPHPLRKVGPFVPESLARAGAH